jgi:hypothetical protein
MSCLVYLLIVGVFVLLHYAGVVGEAALAFIAVLGLVVIAMVNDYLHGEERKWAAQEARAQRKKAWKARTRGRRGG